ncbi:MAG: glycoside hydrolase family 10 protein [Candidatus Brocadiia bacterium]
MIDAGLAVWAHSVYQFGDADEIARHADRLAQGGFDILIPSVKNPPGSVDFFTDVGNVNEKYPDWDPLRVIIDECNARGVKVHPWFCIFPEGEESRLLNEHPECEAQFESRFPWACACNPTVQDYLFELYRDLAQRYKPAGLHLDYIRTGGNCTCDYCQIAMQKRDVDITEIEYRDPDFQKWVEFRISNITGLVERVHDYTRDHDLELSAAVFADYPRCSESQGQDWVDWTRQGLVDYIFPMNYTNSLRMAEARAVCHKTLVGNQVPLWEGLGKASSCSALSTADLELQVDKCLDAGANGIVLFSYPAVTDEDIQMLNSV